MKIIKRIAGFLVFLLLIFVVAAIAIPILYKDKIVQLVKTEANKTLNATMDFQEVDISLLRSFPKLNVQLEKVTVDGIAPFEGVRLFDGEAIEVEMNVLDAFAAKDNFPITSLHLYQPAINILVLEDGTANWDIVKPSEETTEESSNYLVKLKQYVIENGNFTYIDKGMDLEMYWKDINHTGSGAFASDEFDLDTKTYIADLTATLEGVDYLDRAKVELDAMINMNVPELKFTLKDNMLLVNALKINTEGTFDMNDDNFEMDLAFQSPQGDFKSLWSLIPGVYTEDFAEATILGKMGFKGFVKGIYDPTIPRYPAFQINADVANGKVKYPDLPIGVTGISTNVNINSPSSDFDRMIVKVPNFSMKLGDNPINGNFNLKRPISDPTVNGALKGTIDLAELGRAVPIEGITNLKGIIQSDIVFDASQSQLENEQYDQVNVDGQMNMQNVVIEQTGTPPVAIRQLEADFSPQRVKVTTFKGKLGESDVQATGQVNNILAYFSPEQTMEGNLTFSSNYFNANEWMSEDTTTTVEPIAATTEVPFDRFQFDIDGTINKMDYDIYELRNTKMKGKVSPNESTIQSFATKIGKSDLNASGKVNNLMDYALKNEVMTGEIQLRSNYLDLNQFMVEEETTTSSEPLEVIPVPKNIDLMIHSNLKNVRYTNFNLTNIRGDVLVKEEKAEMKDVVAKILGGKVKFDGAYDTQDLSKPKFSIAYQLDKLDFNNAFKTFNTFRAIAPLAKYIDGKFSTNLKMNGTLGKNLIPDLSALNLSGFLHTFGATIRKSPIFDKLSDKLQINALKKVNLQDTKNWLEVKNGYVELEETTHKIAKDIALKVKGRHHLLQEEVFYLVEATIPKKYLNKSIAGQVVNKGWNLLAKEASKRGVDLDNGDQVKLNINVTGSMMNPKFKIIPIGSDGSVTYEDKLDNIVKATTDKIKDSVTNTVNTAVDSVKTIVEEQVETVKDSVNTIIEEETDKLVASTKDQAKELLDSTLAGEGINLDSLKVKDQVKNVLKDLNPFKKKKKGN